MMGIRSRVGFALYLYVILLAGLYMGMNQGYQAQTVENTSIVYENGSVSIGDTQSNINTSVRENATIASGLEGTIQTGIYDFVEELLHASFVMAFEIADHTATVAFYLSILVPKFVVSGMLNVASIAPIGVVTLLGLQRMADAA